MRCRCGQPLRGSQRRCRPCAVDYLRSFATDRFEIQAQIKPIVISEEQIKRVSEMSSAKLPPVPRSVKPWSETEYRKRESRKLWCGVALALVIFTLVLWALLNG